MHEMITWMMERYGRSVSLSTPDGWHSPLYRAFIQPLRYKNKMYLEGSHTEIGLYSPGYYLYIGPAAHDLTRLEADASLHAAGGERYQIDRAEQVFIGEEPLYIWAILRSMTQEVEP